MARKTKETVKCRYCNRKVPVTTKGNLAQHHNLPQYKHCLGSGLSKELHILDE